MTDIADIPSPEFTRLTGVVHWMYGLQAVGLGFAMLAAALVLHPSLGSPWFLKVGVALLGWPGLISMYLYRRDKAVTLKSRLLATHFEYLKSTCLSWLVWLAALQFLYFITVGLVIFNGALLLMGLFAILRTGWGWLMFNHGRPVRQKRGVPDQKAAADEPR